MAIQTPKGTRDFFPADEFIQQYIFQSWQKVCLRFGYEAYEGPTFEHLELYTGKSGEEIVDQLYHFQDKGGRDIALRPEMTPTLARMVASKGNSLAKPCKWFSIPRLFRYERAQKGRLREFFQLNMDILGTDSINAELDLLIAIVHLLKEVGLDHKDFLIGISSRRILGALLNQREIKNPVEVYSALDKRAKVGPEAFKKLLSEAGLQDSDIEFLNEFMSASNLEELKPFCESEEAQAAFAELEELISRMEKLGYGDFVALDLSVVRGLAYYTGVVFEVFDRAKSMRAIAGGGRYDDLANKLGGQKITGVGFGVGDVVLKDLLESKNLLPSQKNNRIDFWIASFADDMDAVFSMANDLRAKGFSVGHSLEFRKFKKQMDEANRNGARKVLFLGSDKVEPGQIEVKDLSSGEQSIQNIEELSND